MAGMTQEDLLLHVIRNCEYDATTEAAARIMLADAIKGCTVSTIKALLTVYLSKGLHDERRNDAPGQEDGSDSLPVDDSQRHAEGAGY